MKLLFVINHLNLHFPNDWKVRKGRHPKDGRVEGSACILSSENSKIAANGWTATDGRMVEPTQKRHRIQGQRRSLEKGRRGKITFRIKAHTFQRCSEGWNKTLCMPGPRDPTRDWARLAFECMSSGLQWGQGLWQQQTREACCMSPTIEPQSRQTHKLEQWPHKGLSQTCLSVQESPVEAWVDSGLPWGQGHWIRVLA